jgi:Ca2+-binding RTX toxin-like protein
VAKSFFFRLFGRDGNDMSSRILGALRESDQDVSLHGGRFFTLFASVAARSDAATSVPGDHDGFAFGLDPLAGLRLQQAGNPGVQVVVPESAVSSDVATEIALATAAGPTPQEAEIDAGAREITVQLGVLASTLSGRSAFGGVEGINYVVSIGEDFQSSLVFDANTKQLLTGGPYDQPEIGSGTDDTLVLSGDYSQGVLIPAIIPGMDMIVVLGGNDYNLSVADDFVAAGHSLTVNGMPLGADDHLIFDGSAESDGRFVFLGGAGNDSFIGGAGDDRMTGLGGADTLAGGRGADVFAYTSASESSGPAYDTLADFDPVHDRIDLPGSVSGFAATIAAGTLSSASFNTDLAALLGGLGPSQAVWLSPNAGDLAGQIFLVVDGNGQAGYQAGQDYVFAVAGSPLADLANHGGIFV